MQRLGRLQGEERSVLTMVTSREIRLKSRPVGMPTVDNFELVTVSVPDPAPDEVQVKNLWMSVDPYMRGRMIDRAKTGESSQRGQASRERASGEVTASNSTMFGWRPNSQLGDVLEGGAIGEVVTSNDPGLKPGDLVFYAQSAARYAAMMDERLCRALEADDLEIALRGAFDTAIDTYTAEGPDGCFVICTAPAEALTNPVCKDILDQSLNAIDARFLRRLTAETKRIPAKGVDLPLVAAQLGATLHSLALRARAGWKQDRLKRLSEGAVAHAVAAFRGERKAKNRNRKAQSR
jgi:N-terminal domain of oxidoreductase